MSLLITDRVCLNTSISFLTLQLHWSYDSNQSEIDTSSLGLTSIIGYCTHVCDVGTSERNDHWEKGRMLDEPAIIYLFSIRFTLEPKSVHRLLFFKRVKLNSKDFISGHGEHLLRNNVYIVHCQETNQSCAID